MFELTNLKVARVKGFNKNPQVLEVGVRIPQLRIFGDNKVLEKYLLLPNHSQGKSNITLDDLRIEMTYFARCLFNKDGFFIAREKSELKCNLQRIHLDLDKLFNGNKELMSFLNDQWNDAFQQLRNVAV